MTKSKTIFDHINNISFEKNEDYFKTLNKSEQKEFNIYMLQRFLSMDKRFTNFISYIDKYSFSVMDKGMYYKLVMSTLPKERNFYKYIKKSKETQEDEMVVDMLSKKLEIPKRRAKEYIHFLSKEDKKELLEGYGVEDKLIKKYK